jgi:hypothetical protein
VFVPALDPLLRTELPEQSAELTMLRVLVEAHLATVSRKRGEAYLRAVVLTLEREEELSAIVPIRGARRQGAVTARREALAWFMMHLPVWLARVTE